MKKRMREVLPNKYAITNEENNIDVHVYLSEVLFQNHLEDEAIKQLYDATMLPGVVSPVVGMPDIHTGYGLPIGGVMATDYETGVVSAGAVGMDINCGVRLITTKIPSENLDKEVISKLLSHIARRVPGGIGRASEFENIKKAPLDAIAEEGVQYFVKQGYGRAEDLSRIEDMGCIKGADISKVSKKALRRADQLGTIGGGNHFVEIGGINSVFDEDLAREFGLDNRHIYIMIHTGSRGFGHQICTDFSNLMWKNAEINGVKAPQRGLACAPISSQDGEDYLKAMACAANYAFSNRQIVTHFVREAFVEVLNKSESDLGLDVLYDVAHNIAKKEKYDDRWLLVHRKGATRALPKGHENNPPCYIKTGHPAIIPGSMGTGSYVVVGTDKICETYCSVNHGAGRVMSRKKARSEFTKEDFLKQIGNVVTNARNVKALIDEAPRVYKDINEVIFTLVDAGLTKPVVKLRPMGVFKGE